MASIHLQNVVHRYSGAPASAAPALKPLDHVWSDGGAYALLGPSGCGKTTMLNIISGLVKPTEGRVLFGAQDVTDVPTERRNIAQVFQFPVLYDTMTVRENLAFPLKARRVDAARIRQRVDEVADLLDLGRYLDQPATHLGAGEKQKISLGRGLVRSDVSAILFDEPLTIVDPQVKFELRRKLKEIHARYRTTLVYVTHDQTEALTFADRVVVMNEGEIVQDGRPEDLFERPAHTFVGHFIGSPGMNFLSCEIAGDCVRLPGVSWPLAPALRSRLPSRFDALQLGVRPQGLRLVDADRGDALPADVTDVEHFGNHDVLTLRSDAGALKARVEAGVARLGVRLGVVLPPAATLLYADARLVGALDAQA